MRCLAAGPGRPRRRQDRPQRQVRHDRPGRAWHADVAGLASDTMIAAYLLGEKGARAEGPGLHPAWRHHDADHRPDRQGQRADHHGPCAGQPGSAVRLRRRRHDPAPAPPFRAAAQRDGTVAACTTTWRCRWFPCSWRWSGPASALDVPLLRRSRVTWRAASSSWRTRSMPASATASTSIRRSSLAGVLFEELKLAKNKRTKTGFSTDSGVLEDLEGRIPSLT